MKRREFISSIAVASLALGCNTRYLATRNTNNDIRWAMGLILWRNNGGNRKISIQEAVQDLHNLGLNGIEYTPRKGELENNGLTRESFRALLKEKGLPVSGHYFGGVSHDAKQKKQMLTSFQETLDSLKFYGAKNVILGPPRRIGGESQEQTIRQAGPVINELGKIALDQGIQLGIHPHYNGSIESPEEIRWAMEMTDPRYVFLSADTGHIALGGGNVLEILRTYKDRLNYFHLKDVSGQVKRPNFGPNLRELGQGEIDFPAIMTLLKEIKYKGWLNVEQDETKLTPRESASQSMEYINKRLKTV
jgi:inosose dehydratase